MRDRENDCIRYLMKEMDPSEELLMERAMMEDEDLLIEVESMRQTLQKLDNLPQADPPSHVREDILAVASEHAREKRRSFLFLNSLYKYAAAAAVALMITAGSVWFYAGTAGSAENITSTQAEQVSPPQSSPKNIASFRFTNTRQPAPAVIKDKVEPWVDRNNILRFEDQFHKDGRSRQFEAILKRSTQKLQRIDNPVDVGQRVKSIQLTGAGN